MTMDTFGEITQFVESRNMIGIITILYITILYYIYIIIIRLRLLPVELRNMIGEFMELRIMIGQR